MTAKILVIDDEPIIADGVEMMIKNHFNGKIDVLKTYSATKAFDMLATNSFDLAVCDIEMPVLTGIELKDNLRSLGILTPIIFLTGYNDFGFVYNAINSQNVFFILKNEPDSLLLNKIQEILAVSPPRNSSPPNEQLIREVEHYIEENILNSINISDIATHLDYNPFYLSRIFKKEKGISLSDYLNSAKIKKSVELITTTDIKIDELAEKMGYSSASSFLVFFKKHTKKTPNQLRNHK